MAYSSWWLWHQTAKPPPPSTPHDFSLFFSLSEASSRQVIYSTLYYKVMHRGYRRWSATLLTDLRVENATEQCAAVTLAQRISIHFSRFWLFRSMWSWNVFYAQFIISDVFHSGLTTSPLGNLNQCRQKDVVLYQCPGLVRSYVAAPPARLACQATNGNFVRGGTV